MLRNKDIYKKFKLFLWNNFKITWEWWKNNFFEIEVVADSQHLATELTVRFKKNRKEIPGLALTTYTSTLTVIRNYFSFNDIFLRQLQALAKIKDLVIGISISGNSKNVVKLSTLITLKSKVFDFFLQ